jgi:hypothetical protein
MLGNRKKVSGICVTPGIFSAVCRYPAEQANTYRVCPVFFLQIPALKRNCFLYTKQGLIDTLHPIVREMATVLFGLTTSNNLREKSTDDSITYRTVVLAGLFAPTN